MTCFRYFVLKNELEKQIYIYLVLLFSTLIILNVYYITIVNNLLCSFILVYTFILLCILLENLLFLRKWEKNLAVYKK